MSASFLRRYWSSLTDSGPPRDASPAGRGRHGYTFGQRYWASLIGVDLPIRPEGATARDVRAVAAPRSPRPARTEPATGHPAARWFSLPALTEPAGLLAADDESVAAEAASPDGRTEFFLRRRDAAGADHTLEVVLRDFDELPAVISVRYRQAGGERELLVPMARQDIGPATAQIALPGFDGGTGWEASVPMVVDGTAAWEPATVATSAGAALNEATRDAWRQVRDLVSDDLRRAIDGALR
ncbi:hypothetical protein [Sphaerisporangium perillae]|uniref:hypothetical protein n=1 Tax=Sphaerisporangium perillae TaxID=2935860 RepID=UPI00200C8D6D|nr:hypothetical protein [Sphaerisporangium perillae]